MLHEPSVSEYDSEDRTVAERTRMGIRLFLLYAIVYGLFVVINLVNPVLMESIVFFGMNLAVTYGIGLIVFAIVLAMIYNRWCARIDADLAGSR